MREAWKRRRVRFAASGVAAAVAVAALASVGLAALTSAGSSGSLAAVANQYPPAKVTICHRTRSKKNPWVKIRVSTRALKAHLRHGDFIVTPDRPCPPKAKNAKKAKKVKKGKRQGAQQKQKNERQNGKRGNGNGTGNGKGGKK